MVDLQFREKTYGCVVRVHVISLATTLQKIANVQMLKKQLRRW